MSQGSKEKELEDDSEEESDYEEMGCGNKQMDTLITAKPEMTERERRKEERKQQKLQGIGKGGVCAPGG